MGLAPTTFFVVFPFTQVMMMVFALFGIAGAAGVVAGVVVAGVVATGALGVEVGVAAGAGATVFSCESLMRMVG